MTEITIGVDISKDTLDAHCHPDGNERQFANTAAGHKALVAWVRRQARWPVKRIVFEPTGPYHRAFERALSKACLPIVKVNPRHARRFAEATGRLAKTDRLDAALLARMGAVLSLPPRPVPDDSIAELKQLLVARDALVKDRTAAKNRAKTIGLALLKQHNAERLRQIDRQLAAIEAEIQARIAADPVLAQRFQVLTSIPGIAAVTAFALLIDMPELGSLNPGQAASLAGLAPVTRQSGRWQGKAFIRGGRAAVRRALYMPALVALRYNPDLKAKYDHLTAAGKVPKVAITAVMRKLVVLANALLKADRIWQPARA